MPTRPTWLVERTQRGKFNKKPFLASRISSLRAFALPPCHAFLARYSNCCCAVDGASSPWGTLIQSGSTPQADSICDASLSLIFLLRLMWLSVMAVMPICPANAPSSPLAVAPLPISFSLNSRSKSCRLSRRVWCSELESVGDGMWKYCNGKRNSLTKCRHECKKCLH